MFWTTSKENNSFSRNIYGMKSPSVPIPLESGRNSGCRTLSWATDTPVKRPSGLVTSPKCVSPVQQPLFSLPKAPTRRMQTYRPQQKQQWCQSQTKPSLQQHTALTVLPVSRTQPAIVSAQGALLPPESFDDWHMERRHNDISSLVEFWCLIGDRERTARCRIEEEAKDQFNNLREIEINEWDTVVNFSSLYRKGHTNNNALPYINDQVCYDTHDEENDGYAPMISTSYRIGDMERQLMLSDEETAARQLITLAEEGCHRLFTFDVVDEDDPPADLWCNGKKEQHTMNSSPEPTMKKETDDFFSSDDDIAQNTILYNGDRMGYSDGADNNSIIENNTTHEKDDNGRYSVNELRTPLVDSIRGYVQTPISTHRESQCGMHPRFHGEIGHIISAKSVSLSNVVATRRSVLCYDEACARGGIYRSRGTDALQCATTALATVTAKRWDLAEHEGLRHKSIEITTEQAARQRIYEDFSLGAVAVEIAALESVERRARASLERAAQPRYTDILREMEWTALLQGTLGEEMCERRAVEFNEHGQRHDLRVLEGLRRARLSTEAPVGRSEDDRTPSASLSPVSVSQLSSAPETPQGGVVRTREREEREAVYDAWARGVMNLMELDSIATSEMRDVVELTRKIESEGL